MSFCIERLDTIKIQFDNEIISQNHLVLKSDKETKEPSSINKTLINRKLNRVTLYMDAFDELRRLNTTQKFNTLSCPVWNPIFDGFEEIFVLISDDYKHTLNSELLYFKEQGALSVNEGLQTLKCKNQDIHKSNYDNPIEALRAIDKKIIEYGELKLRNDKSDKEDFSGVDTILSQLYDFMTLIGESNSGGVEKLKTFNWIDNK